MDYRLGVSWGVGTRMLLRAAVVGALFTCLHAVPAHAAPTLTIDSGPEGPTNSAFPTFGFTVLNATTVECSVDQGTEAFGDCTTASSHTGGPLVDGEWTFRVLATDDLLETAIETRTFTVDTQAPTVTLNGGPSGPTNDPEPSFSWTAAGDDASLRTCSLDSGTPSFGPCTAATEYDQTTPLAEGSYTFRIRVVDEAGNIATDTRNFTVDVTPPAVSVSTGPAGPTNDPRPGFSWTAAGDDASLRRCSIYQVAPDFGPCTAFNRHDQPTRLDDGAYFFRIRVTDPAGNIATDTREFSIDTAGPAAAVAGPNRTGNRRPTFLVSSPEAGAVLRCRIDEGPSVACGPTFTPGRRLKPGRHTLLVTAFDTLGNPGPPATLRFKVLRPPLQAGRAEQTVAVALRRHKFANRVMANLERSCTRLGRFTFSCRFSSTFPGYKLTGRGPVELRRGQISYRFRVRAQGRRMVLTDENEGRFPG